MIQRISTISPGLAKPYSSSITYEKGEWVLYHNAYWQCKTAILTPEEWNEEHWGKKDELLAIKADLVGGKVPESQLPSYVDDVSMYDKYSNFPALGEDDKIYVDKSTNKSYRWSTDRYVIIGSGAIKWGDITGSISENADLSSELDNKLDKSVAISWSQLKTMRDNGKLVYGVQYRITDYVATVTNDETAASASHPFDIIVIADDENTLNERARAIQHDGDTYFASCNLAAWEVWYCLDNDKNRFAWADETNGKGIVYRLIDEFQNDCPYDFKGIKFYRDGYLYYTFDKGTSSDNIDYSLDGISNGIYSNKIGSWITNGKQSLNNIVFKGSNCYDNTFGADCHDNTFGNNCYSNTFGTGCYSNTFSTSCQKNTFGNGCYSNTFSTSCQKNTFGNGCYSNKLSAYCQANILGKLCYNNVFRSNLSGPGSYNTLVNYCSNNTFDIGCVHNTFGSNCRYNTLGRYCHKNTFGNSCQYNTFGNDSATKSYCRYIRVASGNQYLYISPTGTTSSSAYYQNVEIKEGVNNTTTYKTITDANVGQTFLTTYKPANSKEISV